MSGACVRSRRVVSRGNRRRADSRASHASLDVKHRAGYSHRSRTRLECGPNRAHRPPPRRVPDNALRGQRERGLAHGAPRGLTCVGSATRGALDEMSAHAPPRLPPLPVASPRVRDPVLRKAPKCRVLPESGVMCSSHHLPYCDTCPPPRSSAPAQTASAALTRHLDACCVFCGAFVRR